MPALTPPLPLEKNTAHPMSGPRAVLLSTLGAALLAATFFCPRFWLWPAAGLPLAEFIELQPEFHRAFHALRQLADPWLRIDDPVNRVIEWRLLWPSVGHALALPPGAFLALPHLGCLVALAIAAGFAWRATRELMPTACAAILVATSSWFFVSTGWLAYFDSWLVTALLLAGFAQSRWTLVGVALLAPWIDERFILALPLCVATRMLRSTSGRRELLRDIMALTAGIAPYLAVRLGVEVSGTRATSGSYWSEHPLVPASLPVMAFGAWNGLRLGWVFVVLGAAACFRQRKRRVAIVVALAALVLNLCVADDISRSASVAVPLLLATMLAVWRQRPEFARRALPLLTAANLVLPAQHIIAAPGTAAGWHAVPILAADAEIERARHPPEFADSAVYVRRSTDHLQSQLIDRARAAAEIAIRFGPNSGKAVANRAILLYVAGQKVEGMAELDRALTFAPALYDARMQRAAFRQQAGDLRGALDDVREALRAMPGDWPRRKDAEQFAQALASRVAP